MNDFTHLFYDSYMIYSASFSKQGILGVWILDRSIVMQALGMNANPKHPMNIKAMKIFPSKMQCANCRYAKLLSIHCQSEISILLCLK